MWPKSDCLLYNPSCTVVPCCIHNSHNHMGLLCICCWIVLLCVIFLFSLNHSQCSVTVDNVIERIIYLVPAHILLILFLWSYFKTIFTPVGAPSPKVICDIVAKHYLLQFHLPDDTIRSMDEAPTPQERNAILEHYVRQNNIPVTMRDWNGGMLINHHLNSTSLS